MVDRHPRKSARQLALLPVRIVVAVLVLISEVIRPVYRPFVRWVSAWPIVVHFSDFVSSLPRGVILVLFAIPFAIAEPLKIYALILMAKGHLIVGLVIIILAYLMSFVLVERIFHAGREKLLTYAWLKWIMDRVEIVQNSLAEMKTSIKALIRRWLKRAA